VSDEFQREPWSDGPDEEAPPESWLGLDEDDLLHRIETVTADADEDERLLEVVASHRHFFIRQEAAKKVKDPRFLYRFEDDRHIGQILVRHLSRREDLTYLERISMLSRHAEVRKAAQVQLARVWRRLESPDARQTGPLPKWTAEAAAAMNAADAAANKAEKATPAAAPAAAPEPPPVVPSEAPVAPAEIPAEVPLAVDKEGVDGSLLGWAVHFVVEQAWHHLGTPVTKGLLDDTYAALLPQHPTLRLFTVGTDARVRMDLSGGLQVPAATVRGLALWMADFRRAARAKSPEAASVSVRACTNLMADALRSAGFYATCDEVGADPIN
jgi:hypothetical protein